MNTLGDHFLRSSAQQMDKIYERALQSTCLAATRADCAIPNPPISLATWIALKSTGVRVQPEQIARWGSTEIRAAVTAEVSSYSPYASMGMISSQRRSMITRIIVSDEVLRILMGKLMCKPAPGVYGPANIKPPEEHIKLISGAISLAHGFRVFADWYRAAVRPLVPVVSGAIDQALHRLTNGCENTEIGLEATHGSRKRHRSDGPVEHPEACMSSMDMIKLALDRVKRIKMGEVLTPITNKTELKPTIDPNVPCTAGLSIGEERKQDRFNSQLRQQSSTFNSTQAGRLRCQTTKPNASSKENADMGKLHKRAGTVGVRIRTSTSPLLTTSYGVSHATTPSAIQIPALSWPWLHNRPHGTATNLVLNLPTQHDTPYPNFEHSRSHLEDGINTERRRLKRLAIDPCTATLVQGSRESVPGVSAGECPNDRYLSAPTISGPLLHLPDCKAAPAPTPAYSPSFHAKPSSPTSGFPDRTCEVSPDQKIPTKNINSPSSHDQVSVDSDAVSPVHKRITLSCPRQYIPCLLDATSSAAPPKPRSPLPAPASTGSVASSAATSDEPNTTFSTTTSTSANLSTAPDVLPEPQAASSHPTMAGVASITPTPLSSFALLKTATFKFAGMIPFTIPPSILPFSSNQKPAPGL